MSIELIRESYPVARKEHDCEACYALLQSMVFPDDFTDEEVAILQKAKDDGWKIKIGEKYTSQTCKYDDIYTFKAKTDVLPIYFKYEMNDI